MNEADLIQFERDFYIKAISRQCAFPGCRKASIQRMRQGDLTIPKLEICHIVALSPNGARANLSLPRSEKASYENWVILCSDHHYLVDTHPEIFTIEFLKEIKRRIEEDIKQDFMFSLSKTIENINSFKPDHFIHSLTTIQTGVDDARRYQQLVFDIINYLFIKDLVDGRMEEKTHEGTERRDIIYINEAVESFWSYIRMYYGNFLVMFEIKNVAELEIRHIDQTANYLGRNIGMMGFLVTRNPLNENIIRKLYAVYNKSTETPPKTILVLCDADLENMIRLKLAGRNPGDYMRNIYRKFLTSIQ